jgi:hypothetical protein
MGEPNGGQEHPAHEYDLWRRNCCHVADEFTRRGWADGGWIMLRRLVRQMRNMCQYDVSICIITYPHCGSPVHRISNYNRNL